MKKAVVLCLVTFCTTSSFCNFGYGESSRSKTDRTLSVADQIRASVYRYQISKFGVKYPDASHYFFLCVGLRSDGDPSLEIVKMLQSRLYAVKGVSSCIQSTAGVFDRKSNAKGLALSIASMKFTSPANATVKASLYRDEKGGFDALFMVERKLDGEWVVGNYKILDVH